MIDSAVINILLHVSLPLMFNFSLCSAEDLMGYEPEELLSDYGDDLDYIHPADLSYVVPSRKSCKLS